VSSSFFLRVARPLVVGAAIVGFVGCEEQSSGFEIGDGSAASIASVVAAKGSPALELGGEQDVPRSSKSAGAPRPEWQAQLDGWRYPGAIPNFELVNQHGSRFRLADFADSYVLVGFVFTHCGVPAACPRTMEKMGEVQRLWQQRQKRGESRGKKLQLLTLTFDPTNDTPDVLAAYGKRFGVDLSSWTLATGPARLLSEGLPSIFGLLAVPDGQGSIAHSVKAALLEPGLSSIKEWDNNDFEPAAVVELVASAPRK
jgi:cytochrome oxidase Cu insertion factor (SCO1/SenC/PrrC family)